MSLAADQNLETVSIPPNEYLALAGDWAAAEVTSGEPLVSHSRMVDGRPVGFRRFVCSLEAGSIALAEPLLDSDGEEWGIILVADDEFEAAHIDVDAKLRSTTGRSEFLSHLSSWLEQLYCASSPKSAPATAVDIATIATNPIPDDVANVRCTDLRVVRFDVGGLCWIGDDGLPVEEAGPFAVSAGMWFGVRAPARGTTGDCDADSLGSAVCFNAARELLRLLMIHVARQTAIEQDRLQEANEHERLAAQNVLAALAVERNLRVTPGESDRLFDVIYRIGLEMGMELKRDKSGPDASTASRLTAIAAASGIRLRRVRLPAKWWQGDAGHLLAFDDDGEPVGLICTRYLFGLARRYQAYYPGDVELRPLKSSQRQKLREEAFSIVEPLPITGKKLSILDISKYAVVPYLGDVALMSGLSFVASLAHLVILLSRRVMLDYVIPDANRSLLIALSVAAAAMSLGIFAFSLCQGLVSINTSTSSIIRLQSAVVDRLLRVRAAFFREYSAGELFTRSMTISAAVTQISRMVGGNSFSIIGTVLQLAFCFYFSHSLAYIALAAAVASAAISVPMSLIVRRVNLRMSLASGKLLAYTTQLAAATSKLQAANAEERAYHQWAYRFSSILRMRRFVSRVMLRASVLNTLISTSSTVALYYFAGRIIVDAAAASTTGTPGQQVITVGLFFAFHAAFQSVVNKVTRIFGSLAELDQLYQKRLLIQPILEAEVEDPEERICITQLRGEVQVDGVTFGYHPDSPPCLQNVSFHVRPGQFVAIVGRSGSGKSTLLRLMLGLDQPTAGRVLFDGNDLETLNRYSLRRHMGVVFQEAMVPAGSILDLISGPHALTWDEAWAAAEEAAIAEDIRGMPMGMHTFLAEGAPSISTGQRQRMLLARALAANPSMVVLDEATSALDNRTQEHVMRRLGNRNITKIVVAHRLATIQDADVILVLEQGRIVQAGGYEELVSRPGFFLDLVRRQLL